MTENSNVSPSAGIAAPLISFPLLELVCNQRNQYGLRHQDYGRYHKHLTSRLKYLRKKLHVSQAGRRRYVRIDLVTKVSENPKVIEVLLLLAERAWSYGHELQENFPNKKGYINQRFWRASVYALRISDIAHFDVRTKLQVGAYASMMRGIYLLRKGNAEELNSALTELTNARTILNKALRTRFFDSDIETQIRFATHKLAQLGKQTTLGEEIKLDQSMLEESWEGSLPVSLYGRPLGTISDPALILFMNKAMDEGCDICSRIDAAVSLDVKTSVHSEIKVFTTYLRAVLEATRNMQSHDVRVLDKGIKSLEQLSGPDLRPKLIMWRALRNLTLAQKYAGKCLWIKALLLSRRSGESAQDIRSELAEAIERQDKLFPIPCPEFREFDRMARAAALRYHAEYIYEKASGPQADWLYDTFHRYQYKPPKSLDPLQSLDPIPCKPLFFDLAFDYIDPGNRPPSPVARKEIQARHETGPSGREKGWVGWILGGGK